MRIPFVILILAAALPPGPVMARPADVPSPARQNGPQTVQVQINQPLVSKTLGNLALPFMWEPQEDESQSRLVVTQTRTHAPAVLTIDLLSLPKSLEESSVAAEIIASSAKQIGVTDATVNRTEVRTECDRKDCPTLTFFSSDFTGTENGIERRCTLRLLPRNGKMLILTLCAAASQVYEPDLPQILEEVYRNME